MTGPVLVLGGLLVAAGTFYLITRIALHRALDADQYRHETADRIEHAAWRRHDNVVYLPDGYAFRPDIPEGGGDREARMGLVMERPVAGGNGGSASVCRYCGVFGGHTGQCPVVSRSSIQQGEKP